MSRDPCFCLGALKTVAVLPPSSCKKLKYEILKPPHPNIAQYHGCLVENGRIRVALLHQLHIERTLTKRKDITEEEKLAYSKAIEDGIRYYRRLGLAHNDTNPSNIMMDDEKPVVIDFDSTRLIGEKLGNKAGTFGWKLEGAEFSEPENDLDGLKIQKWPFRSNHRGSN